VARRARRGRLIRREGGLLVLIRAECYPVAVWPTFVPGGVREPEPA
jgi:hypothetical protein